MGRDGWPSFVREMRLMEPRRANRSGAARWHENGNQRSVRARRIQALMVVSVVSTALATGACHKSAAEERREAEQATNEAEQKAQQASETSLTSAEIGNGSDAKTSEDEAREAKDRALREQAEAITGARNEQLEYRGKLQGALDDLDAKRREAKKRGASYVKAVDARREVLKHHLDALDRTTDTEWAGLKAKIDRDLKNDRDLEGR